MHVYLRSEDPAHNRRRHYLVSLQRNLWGQLVVIKQWGRIGAPGWQGSHSVEVTGLLEGAKAVQETLKRRCWNGYEVVGGRDGCWSPGSMVNHTMLEAATAGQASYCSACRAEKSGVAGSLQPK